MIELSIVIPMFNEEKGLEQLFERLKPCIEQVTTNYEIVCVDDGSGDNTYNLLRDWHHRDPRIKVVHFARNFGKEAALTAGVDFATGKAVIPIDADLQDPPELIPEMVKQWKAGYKVVLATRKGRPGDSWLKRHSANAFYRVMNYFSSTPIPANTGDFRLMDRVVVDAVRQLPERTRFMKGIFAWVGFSTTTLHFERQARAAGSTTFSYARLTEFALDGIFSFTTVPLRVWTYIGALISILSFIWASCIVLKTLLYGNPTPGYSSLIVTVLFMGGMQLLSVGILGEYIGRIYRETKQRPIYLVEETLGL